MLYVDASDNNRALLENLSLSFVSCNSRKASQYFLSCILMSVIRTIRKSKKTHMKKLPKIQQ